MEVFDNIHIILLVPSDTAILRDYAEKLTTLLADAHMIWFHPWSQETLLQVACHEWQNLDLASSRLGDTAASIGVQKENLASFMTAAYQHAKELGAEQGVDGNPNGFQCNQASYNLTLTLTLTLTLNLTLNLNLNLTLTLTLTLIGGQALESDLRGGVHWPGLHVVRRGLCPRQHHKVPRMRLP